MNAEQRLTEFRNQVDRLTKNLSPKQYLEFLEGAIDYLSALEDCAIEESEEK